MWQIDKPAAMDGQLFSVRSSDEHDRFRWLSDAASAMRPDALVKTSGLTPYSFSYRTRDEM